MQFLKGFFKLLLQAPRPLWIWADIQCYGADISFAAPAGHTVDAAFIVTVAIFDTFFASNHSRRRFPSSNAFSLSENKLVLLIMLFIGILFIRKVMNNQIFLGKNTFDQSMFGVQLGIWAALYLHFCWRDQIHRHITVITQVPRLRRERAYRYMTIASVGYVALLLATYAQILVIETTMHVDQVWLKNLQKCGEDIEQVDHKLVSNENMFAAPELRNTARFGVLYSSYIGLILYRLNGFGRMPYDLFFHREVKPRKQLILLGVLCAGAFAAWLPTTIADFIDIYTVQIIVCNLVPFLVLGLFSTYIMPLLAGRLIRYPKRIPDEDFNELESEEKFLCEEPTLPDVWKDGEGK